MSNLRFAAPKEKRVAVITGGARGIGGATAIRLAEDGRDVVIADLLADEARETMAQIEALGQRAIFIPTDVSDEAAVREMVAQTMQAFGRLDILVCCAGIFGKETPYLDIQGDVFERFLKINVLGVHYAHQAAIPHMLAQKWGRCVTMTSGARLGATHNVPYGVSKGAAWSFVQALGNAYPKDNVFVNGVEPGRALTQMVVPRFSQAHLDNPGVPIGRYSDADEVAEELRF
ncbi:MAG: SDR family oxidoreductase [Anaerolineae bacterium]|nr:SDR family oxidoreductase [Anaerolineae bacterium]